MQVQVQRGKERGLQPASKGKEVITGVDRRVQGPGHRGRRLGAGLTLTGGGLQPTSGEANGGEGGDSKGEELHVTLQTGHCIAMCGLKTGLLNCLIGKCLVTIKFYFIVNWNQVHKTCLASKLLSRLEG